MDEKVAYVQIVGGLKMKDSREERVMTYDQWKRLYIKCIRKKIKKNVKNGIYCIGIFIAMTIVPFGMFIHWVLIGY